MTTQAERITISLPRNLIELADEVAVEKGISRSKVVSTCLQEFADKRLRAEMEEGYRAMANENLKFAKDAIYAANEILPDWK